MRRVAIMKYPGTNCENETLYAVRNVSKLDGKVVWHSDFKAREWDAVVLPGGFSYGDYGRAGLIASWSKASRELLNAFDYGLPILGICNGFQVLSELGILPGNLLRNASAKFIAKWVKVKFHNPRGPWLSLISDGEVLPMPIAHAEGRYYIDDVEPIIGEPWAEYLENPNGSIQSIAGVSRKGGVALGIMPHPERATFPWQSLKYTTGGRRIFESIGESLRRGW
ncbi:MAG: phosphoribosylformylglycinamidine synthase I [Caldisphaeraceae archaeon]|nr:phosphoribosylformylglycinamidine synthase I [Caldisphaeraceae archaeon]MEB3797477.1 phosphoribosylformylglycinamidine synthase I [Caldisphaeraceae archaeon]